MFFRKAKKNSFEEDFRALVQKYELEGKIDLHEYWEGGKIALTLVPIVETREKPSSVLPSSFLSETRELIRRHYGSPRYLVGRAGSKTMTEIEQEQKAWDEHCELFWLGAD